MTLPVSGEYGAAPCALLARHDVDGTDRAAGERSRLVPQQLHVADDEAGSGVGVDAPVEVAGRDDGDDDGRGRIDRRQGVGTARRGRRRRHVDVDRCRCEHEARLRDVDEPVAAEGRRAGALGRHAVDAEGGGDERDAHLHLDVAWVGDDGARARSDELGDDRERERAERDDTEPSPLRAPTPAPHAAVHSLESRSAPPRDGRAEFVAPVHGQFNTPRLPRKTREMRNLDQRFAWS